MEGEPGASRITWNTSHIKHQKYNHYSKSLISLGLRFLTCYVGEITIITFYEIHRISGKNVWKVHSKGRGYLEPVPSLSLLLLLGRTHAANTKPAITKTNSDSR